MSRLVIISCIMSVIIALGIVSIVYLNNTLDQMEDVLSEILYDCINEDADALTEKSNRLSALWDSRKSVLGLFINRSSLEEVRALLEDMNSLGQTKSYESAYTQAVRVKYTLNHLFEMEIPSPQNLF